MVNCNPETVSTDYDTSDRLYFEPLTLEDVLEVVHAEQQAGPVARRRRAARRADAAGPGAAASRTPACRSSAPAPRRSTWPRTAARSAEVLADAGLLAPKHGTATSYDEARRIAAEIGYPVLVRPSYVLGGRGMEIVYDEEQLRRPTWREATEVVRRAPGAGRPVPRRRDRDRRRRAVRRRGALPRRRDGAHRGGRHPLRRLGLRAAAGHPGPRGDRPGPRPDRAIARGIGVRGLLNVQFALAADVLYVLEANPRASRTAPFVSKATGVPLAKAAARVMLGAIDRRPARRGPAAGHRRRRRPADARRAHAGRGEGGGAAVQAVPHRRGPRGRPHARPGDALHRRGDGHRRDLRHRVREVADRRRTAACPTKGTVFVSMANRDKRAMIFPVKRLADLGFADPGHRGHRRRAAPQRRRGRRSCASTAPAAGRTASRPSSSAILAGEVDMVVNTPSAGDARADGYEIRTAAVAMDRPIITTVQELAAAVQGIEALGRGEPRRPVDPGLDRRPALRATDARRPAVSEGPLQVARRGAVDPAGRRVPPPDAGRPGHRRAHPAGPLRRARRRRRGHRAAAAPRVLGLPGQQPRASTAAPSRSCSPCTAPAPPGWPRSTRTTPVDVVGPLGRPFSAAAGPGQRDAGRRRLRQRAAVRAGRAAARPAAAGSTSCSAPPARTGCSACWTPSGWPRTVAVTTDDGSAGIRGRVTDVLPERDGRGAHRRRLRLRPDGDAARGHRGGRRPRRRQPVRRRGVDGLRHRGLHDLRAAGRRRRRRAPGWCAPASRARCSRATGCAGPTSAPSPPTPSARRRQEVH